MPGAVLAAQYQQSQAAQPCSRDDELPQTHRRSRRLSPRQTDAVWSEVKLNLHHERELQERRTEQGLTKDCFSSAGHGCAQPKQKLKGMMELLQIYTLYRTYIYPQKCLTKCKTFPETGRFPGSSSDIISSTMLSACSTKQAFSPQERWTEGEPELFFFFSKFLYLGELYLQTAVCAKFLLAEEWNDFDCNTQCESNLGNQCSLQPWTTVVRLQ